jgi:hypothetical protein
MYGSPMIVVVDDRLLLTSKSKVAMAPKSPNGAWWVSIMEKAAAKYYGTYENLDEGNFKQAFYALTGMPSFYIPHS